MVDQIKATKKDIEVLLKRAEQRIRSAEILLENKQYNDAISRAYYAFFDSASAALLSDGFLVKTHGGLKAMFNKQFIKTEKMPLKFSRYLDRAFNARQEADYEARKEFSKEAVVATIESAKEFVKEVKKIV